MSFQVICLQEVTEALHAAMLMCQTIVGMYGNEVRHYFGGEREGEGGGEEERERDREKRRRGMYGNGRRQYFGARERESKGGGIGPVGWWLVFYLAPGGEHDGS